MFKFRFSLLRRFWFKLALMISAICAGKVSDEFGEVTSASDILVWVRFRLSSNLSEGCVKESCRYLERDFPKKKL